MPAAAVIPAKIRNIKVVAVKKLVVEFLGILLCLDYLLVGNVSIRLLIFG